MWCDVVEPPLRRSRFAGLTHSGCITPSVILDPLYLLPQSPVCSLCVLQDEPAAQGLSTVGQDALRAPCHSTRQCDRVTASRGVVPSCGSTQVPGNLHVCVPGRIQVARFLHLTRMQEGRACDYFVGRGTLMQPSACLTYVCTSSGNQGSSDVYRGAEDDGHGWFMLECTSMPSLEAIGSTNKENSSRTRFGQCQNDCGTCAWTAWPAPMRSDRIHVSRAFRNASVGR